MEENNKPLILIDGDIILYRAAFACKEMSDWADVREYIWEFMQGITNKLDSTEYVGFLQGKKNFRIDVAKQAEYKGNRKSNPKPFWFYNIKQHLIDSYKFIVVDGMETDDALTILHNRIKHRDTVICSVDKDLLQSPGKHYNPNTEEMTLSTVDLGRKTLATQIITGDSTDNIKGLHRVGPKKAEKILEKAESSGDYLPLALQGYLNYYFDQKDKGNLGEITDEEVFLKATKHFAETFELVFLLRDMDEEEFPTPEVIDLLTIEDPLKYGAVRKSEQQNEADSFFN
jgi:5'-3' exonuclease